MGAKAKRSLLAGALAGFAVVAAAIVLTAASPAPAPADTDGLLVAEIANAVESKAAANGNGSATKSSTEAHQTEKDETAKDEAGAENSTPAETAAQGDSSSDSGANVTRKAAASEPQKKAVEKVSSASSAESSARHWVVDYEQVWVPNLVEVVVEPERTETIYETRDVLVCNVPGCGYSTESSGEMAAHWGQHAMQGIDEGYSSIPRQVAVGTRTIPATTRTEDHGEYKSVESGGHWE